MRARPAACARAVRTAPRHTVGRAPACTQARGARCLAPRPAGEGQGRSGPHSAGPRRSGLSASPAHLRVRAAQRHFGHSCCGALLLLLAAGPQANNEEGNQPRPGIERVKRTGRDDVRTRMTPCRSRRMDAPGARNCCRPADARFALVQGRARGAQAPTNARATRCPTAHSTLCGACVARVYILAPGTRMLSRPRAAWPAAAWAQARPWRAGCWR